MQPCRPLPTARKHPRELRPAAHHTEVPERRVPERVQCDGVALRPGRHDHRERGLPGRDDSAELGERHRDPSVWPRVLLELRHPGPFLGGHHPEVERGEHPGECEPHMPAADHPHLVARPGHHRVRRRRHLPLRLTERPARRADRPADPLPLRHRRDDGPHLLQPRGLQRRPGHPLLSAADQSGGGLHPRPVGELDLPGREVAGAKSLHQTREHTRLRDAAAHGARELAIRAHGHEAPNMARRTAPASHDDGERHLPPGLQGRGEGLPDGEFGHGVPCSSPNTRSGVSGA